MIDSSKLQIPAAPHGVVARLRTNKLLDVAGQRPVTVLHAPAGFGKTTAVLGWLEDSPVSVAWLSLDAYDNDPNRLGAHLFAALDRAIPGLVGEAQHALDGGSDLIATCLPLLSTAIRASPALNVVLVLDDYHVITDPACHELIRACVRAVMPSIRTIVTSRTKPLLRLRASDIGTLTTGDLSFRAAETEELLNGSYKLGLTESQLRELEARVHGWPVGLALLAAARAAAPHSRSMQLEQQLADMSRGTLADYVIQEILDYLAPEVREFLVRTSMLERLCASLCVAVLKDPGAEALLEEAGTSSPTIVELSAGWRWIRIHDLIRNALRENLARSEPDLLPKLHLRAAIWFADNEMPAEAISHAIATGDGIFAAETVASSADDLLAARQYATLRRALDAMPSDRGPLSAFCDALELRVMVLHDGVDHGIARSRAQELADRFPQDRGVARMTDPILVSPLAGDVAGAVAAGRSALARQGSTTQDRMQFTAQLALSLWFAGDFKAARELVQPLVGAGLPPTITVAALTVLGMVEWIDGATDKAEQLLREALTEAAGAGGQTATEFIGIHGSLAGALLSAGKLDEAREQLEIDLNGRELLRAGSLGHALTLLLDARLALAERRRNRARSSFSRCSEMFGRFPDVGHTVELWLEQVKVALATPAEETLLGTMPTPAELRVLTLLAEGHSRSQIADRLYLSDATVKSHLRRLYRRLGVSSRADAVIVAKQRGIVAIAPEAMADV